MGRVDDDDDLWLGVGSSRRRLVFFFCQRIYHCDGRFTTTHRGVCPMQDGVLVDVHDVEFWSILCLRFCNVQFPSECVVEYNIFSASESAMRSMSLLSRPLNGPLCANFTTRRRNFPGLYCAPHHTGRLSIVILPTSAPLPSTHPPTPTALPTHQTLPDTDITAYCLT